MPSRAAIDLLRRTRIMGREQKVSSKGAAGQGKSCRGRGCGLDVHVYESRCFGQLWWTPLMRDVETAPYWGKRQASGLLCSGGHRLIHDPRLDCGQGGSPMMDDDLRRYRDCARDLAQLADPFTKLRLLALAHRYEERMNGKQDHTTATLRSVPKAERVPRQR